MDLNHIWNSCEKRNQRVQQAAYVLYTTKTKQQIQTTRPPVRPSFYSPPKKHVNANAVICLWLWLLGLLTILIYPVGNCISCLQTPKDLLGWHLLAQRSCMKSCKKLHNWYREFPLQYWIDFSFWLDLRLVKTELMSSFEIGYFENLLLSFKGDYL